MKCLLKLFSSLVFHFSTYKILPNSCDVLLSCVPSRSSWEAVCPLSRKSNPWAEHRSCLPSILTQALKEEMGNSQSNEITSSRSALGCGEHAPLLGEWENVCVCQIPPKKAPGGAIMMPMAGWCLWSTKFIGVVLREAILRWKIPYHVTNHSTQVCQHWQTHFGNTQNSIILAKLPHPWQITGCLLENISSQSCYFLFFSYIYVPSIFPSWQRPGVFWEGLKIGFISTECYLVVGQGCN